MRAHRGTTEPDCVPAGTSSTDRGSTFIEVLIAIVLLGTTVIPVLAAVRGAIIASSVSIAAAGAETTLVNSVEVVQRASGGCDYPSTILSAYPGASIGRQEYFDVGLDAWRVGSASTPACPDGAQPARLLQRITISVTSPDGKVTRTLQVVRTK